jgi:peptidoglycan/LPS O-acetylase OafA/YrhL
MIEATNPVFALLGTLIALASSFAFVKIFGYKTEKNRYESIDGLRGYLAFFVFLHHSAVWFFRLHTDLKFNSFLFTGLGSYSVSLFFMITAFLFASKILDSNKKPIDWLKLYVSRVLRLVPLYTFMMVVLVSIVMCLSGFTLKEPLGVLCIKIARWMSFTIFGRPDLNGLDNTYLIISGVNWTLGYEWLFYFSLPLLAFVLIKKVTVQAIIFSLIMLALIIYGDCCSFKSAFFMFIGGVFAAFLNRSERMREIVCSKSATIVALVCIVFAISMSIYIPIFSKPFLIVSFAILACGNKLFGLLSSVPAKFLGEISYSVYLLHGLFLFVIFKLVLGNAFSSQLSPIGHWGFVLGGTPIFLFFCCLTFKFIEQPFLQKTTQVTSWLRAFKIGPLSLSHTDDIVANKQMLILPQDASNMEIATTFNSSTSEDKII